MSKLDLSRPLIMGILNITPDSFSDGGKYTNLSSAVNHAKEMIKQGADIIDVGGESSRPGSSPVSLEEEKDRVIPVIKELAKEDIPISIDTVKPEVARLAVESGASIVNDISGLSDKDMREFVDRSRVSVIIMHMLGEPKTMQDYPKYDDVVSEIKEFFSDRIGLLKKNKNIILDPGIGFGKTTKHNLEILKRLDEFKSLGYPILVGASRKSFIGNVSNLDIENRLEASLGVAAYCLTKGANIIRVHDVKETKRVIDIIKAIEEVR